MTYKGVGRVGVDKAGGIVGTGARTVITNDKDTAIVSSIITTKPNKGDIIVSAIPTVYAENKVVAIQGAITARGYALQRASENVFAGNEPGPSKIEITPPNISVK